jgi:hypothetical protein
MNGAAHTSVTPASNSAELRRDGFLVADDGGVGRPGGVAVGQDPLVVRQRSVHGELLGGGLASLVDVVVHHDRQAGDDAGSGSPGGNGGGVDAGADEGLDGALVGHPEDRAVGVLTGYPQESSRQRGDQHGHRMGSGLEAGAAQGEIGSLLVDRLARSSEVRIRTYSSVWRPGWPKSMPYMPAMTTSCEGPIPSVKPGRFMAWATEIARLACTYGCTG